MKAGMLTYFTVPVVAMAAEIARVTTFTVTNPGSSGAMSRDPMRSPADEFSVVTQCKLVINRRGLPGFAINRQPFAKPSRDFSNQP